jgi:hypothetical protein
MFYHVPHWKWSLLTLRVVDRLWLRDTLLVIEDPKKEGHNRAWPLELLAPQDRKDQVWVLKECESRLVNLAIGAVDFCFSRFLNC